jgi:glycine betaine/proline transport system ATP-binding protein
MTTAVEFKDVDIIFGDRSKEALAMARAGEDRSVILAKTGAVLGATGANLTVNEGEISVLMGFPAPASLRCCAPSTASTR